jgi:glycosyltransferase involved in cell wall biosynthesis
MPRVKLPKTIAFNLAFIEPGNTGGMESYARELLPEIAKLLADHRLVAFLSRDGFAHYRDRLPGIETVELSSSASQRRFRALYEQVSLMGAVRKSAPETGLIHSMGNTGPLRTGRIAHVATIHDMIPALFPAIAPAISRVPLVYLMRAVARRADRVVTDSESSAWDISRLAPIPRERIDVILLAGGAASVGDDHGFDARAAFDLGPDRFVLAASATLAHKNLIGLIRAFAQIPEDQARLLVLPGYPVPDDHELRVAARALGIEARIRFLGWVEPEALDALYREAECFVLSSLYEGFGLPVLEAMHRGTPVACSDRSSIPEVGGDAVLYFDPEDPASIALAVREPLGDAGLRERLSAAGLERAAEFTWRRTAEQTVESYERAMASRSAPAR